ncbi:MAG: hypothetical protein IAE82_12350 [Opitutaceae bacterium]|nr:hypothetical protein [Opitutaceae bacterium]
MPDPIVMDWTLDSYFPAFDGPEYRRFKTDLEAALAGVHARIEAQEEFEPAAFAGWEVIVVGYEDAVRRVGHLTSYLECLCAADAGNEEFRREFAALAVQAAELKKLEVSLVDVLGRARHDQIEAFLKRDALAGAEFSLRRWREKARKVMPPAEEALAADLEVDGLKAWSRLYDTVSGTLEFTLRHPDGREERVPVARRRALMASADRGVRAAAFSGGNEAWASVEPICAAALNAMAGARLTLGGRRGERHFLEPALYEHRLGLAALSALQEALVQRAEVARAMVRLKARRLGLPAVAWYDLEAPTPGVGDAAGGGLTWEQGVARVDAAFSRAYPALGAFFRAAVERRWFDYASRRGKRPGAFCTSSEITHESRVFMTWEGAMNDVVTLAHEVGHAWHSHVLRAARPLASGYPMTLAESASTFGEMLLIDGLLEDPAVPDGVKLALLDSQARQATGFLLDVPARFEFERSFYEERAHGEVSTARLRELMVAAQRRLFGDALAPGAEDPMFWASKLHFYIAEVPFYNFPYTVGFLFSRALFARFKSEGAAFLPVYEAFLARSGSATCEVLAKDVLGIDLEKAESWAGAIDSMIPAGERLRDLLGG